MEETRQIRIRGARTHNLKNIDLDLPRNQLIVITGSVGLRQVFARLRHALRRRAAPLCRVPVGLRPAVPAAHGEARRRPDRGALAGDFDRTEGDQPQPALDRRHGDRNPRLPAPAIRPRRHALLRRTPVAARGADRFADGRSGAGARRRQPADDPCAGGRQPQRRAARTDRRIAGAGFCPAAGRRPDPRDRRGTEAGQDAQAHHRRRRRPAQGARRHSPAPGRVIRNGAAPRRWPRHRLRDGQPARTLLLGPLCLPALRVFDPGTRAADLFLQQPDGRLSEVRWPRRHPVLRSPAHRRPAGVCRSPPAPSAAGTGAIRSTFR
jgi:hypothetical protein